MYINNNESGLLILDYRGKNINTLVDFYKSGIKGTEKKNLGVEVEHFLVHRDSERTISYEATLEVMERLKGEGHQGIYEEGKLLGYYNEEYAVSLEPAAQLEISISPQESIISIDRIYSSFFGELTKISNDLGYLVRTIGYQPKSRVRDLPLIPKERYSYMDEYFKKTGSYGINMMRGTASTQVSIDYFSEEDSMRKLKLASLLGPILSLITDNSPYFEGQIYQGNLLRTLIWSDVDGKRCGVPSFALRSRALFKDYGEYIYTSPALLLLDGQELKYTGDTTAEEFYKDREASLQELLQLGSMFFPDVRLKSYLEIRVADSMPKEYALGYIALIKGIFYNEEIINELLRALQRMKLQDIKKGKQSLIEYGYKGIIYGRPATYWVDLLLTLGEKALVQEERPYLEPIKKLAEERLTLAELERRGCCGGYKRVK